MPSRNVVKIYVADGYYHIYNRGVEKRIIFEDNQDFKVFLKYLKEYLSPPPKPDELTTSFTLKGSTFKGMPKQPKNYFGKIELTAYCLMPNHFHLLVKQKENGLMKNFMQSLLTRYSMYFNKRYNRVGPLFQGIYKAVLVNEEPYLLHLSRYIHLNPLEYMPDLTKAYSSYGDYLGQRRTSWLNPSAILSYFNQTKTIKGVNTYREFVEAYREDSAEILGNLTLEDTL